MGKECCSQSRVKYLVNVTFCTHFFFLSSSYICILKQAAMPEDITYTYVDNCFIIHLIISLKT